ncbi:MAG TPA: AMP-dependent synthetase, partial [Blastocatellia bacterium]|nr:AMP-dependent synthetase [Blastocatellia bacterium]
DRWQTDETKDQPAVIWEGEEGKEEVVLYRDLFEAVEACAGGLRDGGFGRGDAIGIHLPMMIETVIALLAINRVGAIAVPVFSGYGVDAIASRLNAVQAKGLFTCDGFPRRGRPYDAFTVADKAAQLCDSLLKVFTIGRFTDEFWPDNPACISTPFNHLISDGYEVPPELLAPEPTYAEDPLIIL